ncbi:MAG TPA: hypothetical protein VII11_05725 [Bacteroidota bacterium]
MGLTSNEMLVAVLIAVFYGGVISVILISFWKVHVTSKDIKDIKKILLDLQVSLEQMRR